MDGFCSGEDKLGKSKTSPVRLLGHHIKERRGNWKCMICGVVNMKHMNLDMMEVNKRKYDTSSPVASTKTLT